MLRALLSILLLATTLNVMAANPASPSTTPATTLAVMQDQAVQEDINKLQLEVGILASKMEAFDGKQANQIALLSNQSSYLGSLIAIVSVLITVLAVGAGFFVHKRTEALANKFEADSKAMMGKAEKELDEIKKAKLEATRQFEEHETEMTALHEQADERNAVLTQKFDDLNQLVEQRLKILEAGLQKQFDDYANRMQSGTNQPANASEQENLDLYARMHSKPAEQMTAKDYHVQFISMFARNDYAGALHVIRQALNPAFDASRGDALSAKLIFGQGLCQQKLAEQSNDWTDAIASYELLESKYAESTDDNVRYELAKAMVNLGFTYGQSGQTDQAIETYRRLEKRFADDKEPAIRELLAKAMVNLGVTYGESGQTDQAIETYQRLEQRFADDKEPAIREQLANGMSDLIARYGQSDQLVKTIETWQRLETRFAEDEAPAIREKVASAMLNLSVAYRQLGKIDKAIETYRQLETRFAEDKKQVIRELVATTQIGLGYEWIMQAKQGLEAERIPLLQQALNKLQQAVASCADEGRAMVLGNIGYAHFLLGDTTEAERYTRDCLQLGGEKLYLGHQEDAKQHRLEAQDSEYETLLHELWHSIQQAPDAEQTEPPPAG